MKILGGSGSEALAVRVAQELGMRAERPEIRRFPDGEKYLRVPSDVNGDVCIVIQSIHHTPDELLFEYLLLVDTLKDLGAKKIVSFFPYFAYARQDERYKPGEAISFKTVGKLVESVGTDEIYTIDMHGHRLLKTSEVFRIPSHGLSAMLLLADYIGKNVALDNPLVIGPDAEAEAWAKIVAERLGGDYDAFEKKRLGPERVEIHPKRANAANRNVLIVDDMISTGGTIVEALKELFSQGAQKAVVACTHPILVGEALAKIYESGAQIVIGTDTVPSQVSFVSVAPLIADELRRAGFP